MAERLVTLKITLEEANEIRAALIENRALVSHEGAIVRRSREEQNEAIRTHGPRARQSITQRINVIDNLLKDMGMPPV
jgi:hypothetical protein